MTYGSGGGDNSVTISRGPLVGSLQGRSVQITPGGYSLQQVPSPLPAPLIDLSPKLNSLPFFFFFLIFFFFFFILFFKIFIF